MAFTEHYAILNDFPLFWDPQLLAQGVHLPRYFPDLPTRFGIVPRRGGTDEVRWFEADPTYVLHWINAYEDGDEIVLDGFFQGAPQPAKRPDDSKLQTIYRFLDLYQLQTRPHRWRFNLVTGTTTEEDLTDSIMEFGMINGRHGGRPYRYSYSMTGEPGWFLFDGIVKHDLVAGTEERYAFGEGVFGSETPMAPRVGVDGRGRRLPRDVHDRRPERPLRVPRPRRPRRRRRPDRARAAAGADLERHPLVLGAGV